MSLVSDFQESLTDLNQILTDLEKLERAVQPGGNMHNQLSAISVMRSSTYIVAYNAIERALRDAILGVRAAVIDDQMLYHEVEKFWRQDALRHCLYEVLRQGSRHDTVYQRIDDFFSSGSAVPNWNPANSDLPFSGNVDHASIRDFFKRLGIALSVHRSARGGIDLETIRRNRNSLAHGLEKFSDVGGQVTVIDLKESYHRAAVFMRAVLRALEAYVKKRKYVRLA
jgi:hypothetical protein